MPLAPCRHILTSRPLGILPSFLSSVSSSNDCLTDSQGFFIVAAGLSSGGGAIDIDSEAGTGAPLSLFDEAGFGMFTGIVFSAAGASETPKYSLSPCLSE